MKKITITLAALALTAIASAAEKHNVTLYSPAVIGGQQLKAGQYRLELNNNRVSIRDGKRLIEADVKVETEATKFGSTAVRYTQDNQVTEIRLGGTKTKLLFGNGGANAN